MNGLHELARDAGLLVDWRDAFGAERRVTDESLIAILAALGLDAGNERAVAGSREQLRDERRRGEAVLLIGDAGRPLALPEGIAAPGRARLALEDGRHRDLVLERSGRSLTLPAIDVCGYHRLECRLECGERELRLAIAPPRAYGPGDAAPGQKLWAPAVQIASLQDRRALPFGDFEALTRFARAAAAHGAAAIALSPVHALFPADPSRYSPYTPSSRKFLNVLYADPGPPRENGVPPGPLIDWHRAIPERLRQLRALYDDLNGDIHRLQQNEQNEQNEDIHQIVAGQNEDIHRLLEGQNEDIHRSLKAFCLAGGEELEWHARYDALHAHFHRRDGSRGWQDWPAEFHDPRGAAVAAFARDRRSEVDFYLFLQWLADRGLAAAQSAARGEGMALGLIADFAVGIDAGGSDAWSGGDTLLKDLSVGAPPDQFAPAGQDWGITTFTPRALQQSGFRDFLATIRAALKHAGGVRLDHAMGLSRLWVVPDGGAPADGAYLTYPSNDLMRLLALESWRSRAIVIGEDLGTVPEDFRDTLAERGILGLRVLWFEREADGGFTPPRQWSRTAAAMTGTHDLPTVAGWWQGRDIDWTWASNRSGRFDSEQAERDGRANDRTRLWTAFRESAVASGPEPSQSEADAAVDAAVAYVAGTPCDIAIVSAEDLLGLSEQPNLPGTVDEHPNWRRRLPRTVEDMLDAPRVAARIQSLNDARRR